MPITWRLWASKHGTQQGGPSMEKPTSTELMLLREEFPRVNRLNDDQLTELYMERPELFEEVKCTYGDC
jgi:hypothetical protein